MLDSISISNFKAIKETLTLECLANVNYLVGPNGCGKTKILKTIFYNYWEQNENNIPEEIKSFFAASNQSKLGQLSTYFDLHYVFGMKISEILPDIFFISNFNSKSHFLSQHKLKQKGERIYVDDFIDFNYYQFETNLEILYNHSQFKLIKDEYLQLRFNYWNRLVEKVKYIEELKSIHFLKNQHPCGTIRSGQGIDELDDMIELIFCIKILKDPKLVLIDEPVLHSHPKLQKVIPFLLKCIQEIINTQFFISTHSPFIISAAGELVEKEKKICNKKQKEFKPSQKVYMIEDGICEKSDGFSGVRAVGKAAKMLGAGLKDIMINSTKPFENINTIIIYCESSNSGITDADIYNLIFKNVSNFHVLFISCGNCKEVATQFAIQKEINEISKGKVKIIGLIDKDDDNDTNEKFEDLSILGRRELENYLFDWEIVKQSVKSEITEEIFYEKLKTTKEDFNNFDVKKAIKKELLCQLFTKEFNLNYKENLAKLVIPETQIYKELYNSIFGH